MALPKIIPLFPLPNVVLFPQVLLPLHIFEPRYREMVRDAANGDEIIGMILLRSSGEDLEEPGHDVYGVGCAGRMTRKIDLADGRSNILLQGLREFTVREQLLDRPYRRGVVDWHSPVAGGHRLDPELRGKLVERIRTFAPDENEHRILADPTLSDEMLVNLFCFALDLPFAEKQSLLEAEPIDARAALLLETLEFHLLERDLVLPSEPRRARLQ
jgi:Lon protease-like protein